MKKYLLIFFFAAVTLGAESPAELLRRGDAAYRENNYREAVRVYSEVLAAINPRVRHYVYNNRGLAYRRLNQPAEAMRDMLAAIRLSPRYAAAYCNIGILYVDQGDYPKAMELFNQSLEYNPRSYSAVYNIACVYSLQKKRALAVKNLRMVEGSLRRGGRSLQKLHQEIIRDPHFQNLKGFPPFEELMRDIVKSLHMQKI